MAPRAKKLTPEVIKVLGQLTWATTASGQPSCTLPVVDRKLYVAVNEALEAAGGAWVRGSKCHVFTDPKAAQALREMVTAGKVIDPEKMAEFFETPPDLAERMVKLLKLKPWSRVLEPSAGKGALIKALLKQRRVLTVVAIELLATNRKELDVIPSIKLLIAACERFEDYSCGNSKFDAVIMNPPFAYEVEHVTRAFGMLKPGGRLVAVMSAGIGFKTSAKVEAFHRDVLQAAFHCTVESLPAGTFKSAGTAVNTVLVALTK